MRLLNVITLLGAVFAGFGCATAQPVVFPPTSKALKIDGLADDWAGVPHVEAKMGANEDTRLESNIDIDPALITHDDNYLYVFLRFNGNDLHGVYLAEILIDTDHDRATGRPHYSARSMWGDDIAEGADVSIGVTIAVGASAPGKSWFSPMYLVEREGELVLKQATRDSELIATDADGVEMAIPMNVIGVKPSSIIRLAMRDAASVAVKTLGGAYLSPYTEMTLALSDIMISQTEPIGHSPQAARFGTMTGRALTSAP